MDLQKKLIKLSEYKCSFKYVDSYFLVSMVYPASWSIIPSEDRTIEVAEDNGTTFYAAPIETDIAKAFDLIDDTISYNIDVEKKMSLLKYNISKLQELFAEKDLDELETIEFMFKPKKKTTEKAQATKKAAKKPQKEEHEVKNKEEKKPLKTIADKHKFDDNDNNTPQEKEKEGNVVPINNKNKFLEEVAR